MSRRTCQRCPACKFTDADGIYPVPGEGPRDAEVFGVLEQPGKMENNIGRPAIGKTGEELDKTYLPLAGLRRPDVFIDNACRCKHADSGEAPPPEVVKVCSEFHLRPLLDKMQPSTLVLMGGIANDLLNLDQSIDAIQGTGRIAELWGRQYRVWSSYHPALGFHQGARMQNLLDSFRNLRLFLKGTLPILQDAVPNPLFLRLRTAREVDFVMADVEPWMIALDTESRKTWKGYASTIKYIPWSLQFCLEPGTAYMIYASDKEAVERFGYWVKKFRKILMHNAPHDRYVMACLGILLDWQYIEDTMSMAYIDARLPKGLKPLSYQLLGVTARNFDDVVRPYGIEAAVKYFERAAALDWPKPKREKTGKFRTIKCKECGGKGYFYQGRGKNRQQHRCECGTGEVTVEQRTNKKGMDYKIGLLLSAFKKNPATLDPWKRWEGWGESVDELISSIGPVPLASCELVPPDEFEQYACTDAHSTWRVRPPLMERLIKIRRTVGA